MVPYRDPETILVEYGDQAMEDTPYVCPDNICCSSPVTASQIRTVPSRDPETIMDESGDQATEIANSVCSGNTVHRISDLGLENVILVLLF
jgi:hypothetical protein